MHYTHIISSYLLFYKSVFMWQYVIVGRGIADEFHLRVKREATQ